MSPPLQDAKRGSLTSFPLSLKTPTVVVRPRSAAPLVEAGTVQRPKNGDGMVGPAHQVERSDWRMRKKRGATAVRFGKKVEELVAIPGAGDHR